MYLTITEDCIDLSPGGEVVLRHQTWADYEALLARRQDQAAIRIRFDAKYQEIRLMAPLLSHGNRSDTLGDLVKAMLRHQNLNWHSFDPITLKHFDQKGLEPDSCFYIANRLAILGKERIDLAIDPPPDLALEVDLTSFTHPEDYLEIRIPELWIYRQQALQIYLFRGDHYTESDISLLFPHLPVKQLMPEYVERAWVEGSSVALRAFEQALTQR